MLITNHTDNDKKQYNHATTKKEIEKLKKSLQEANISFKTDNIKNYNYQNSLSFFNKKKDLAWYLKSDPLVYFDL